MKVHEQLDWTERPWALISWVLCLKSHKAEIEELLGLFFFSGAWGCGGARLRFKIKWFLTEFSCLQIQD